MMIKGGIRIGGLRISGYDADAAAYFDRAGVTDNDAKVQINGFVKGLKALGLWSNTIYWTLRSAQNAGTGTTAYSLSGLGTFNGTLAGTPNPTWGTDGIVCTNTDSRIDLPDNASIYGARSAMAVFKTSRTGTQAPFEIQANIDQTGYYFVMGYSGNASNGYTGPRFLITRNSTFGFNQSSSRTIYSGSFQSAQITADNTTDNVFQNGSIATGGAQTGLSSINPTGARNIRGMFYRSDDTVGAFGALSTSKWTDQQVSDLNALYKTTLGTGLGLP
jgi:hypothetical protein